MSQATSFPAWQPIETAPRDGTRILIKHDDRVSYLIEGSPVIARWDGMGDWEIPDDMSGSYPHVVGGHTLVTNPTGWMPLPPV